MIAGYTRGRIHGPRRCCFARELEALRGLSTGVGVKAYCTWLGFDYDDAMRELAEY
jgi:hypothetical protein